MKQLLDAGVAAIKALAYPQNSQLQVDAIEALNAAGITDPDAEYEISKKHGPWVQSAYIDEKYCSVCMCRDKFAAAKECEPHVVIKKRDPGPLTQEEINSILVSVPAMTPEELIRIVEKKHGIC